MSPILDSIVQSAQAILSQLAGVIPRLLIATALFVAAVLGGNIVRRAVHRAVNRVTIGQNADTLDNVLAQLAFAMILIVAGIVALSILGVDVTSLVAGLGLTSLAIGFALKDILENTISGLLILFSRSFSVGDVIKVTDQEGVVTDISLRVTTITSVDGIETLIPNRMVYGSILQNRTAFPTLRRALEFRLESALSAEKACARAQVAAATVSGLASDPAPAAEAFLSPDGGRLVRVYYWIPSRNADPAVGSRVIDAVTAALTEA